MSATTLSESGWKAVLQKSKIKDNGLQKALSLYEKLEDDQYDDRLEAINSIIQLVASLKKAKEIAAASDVLKYLSDLGPTADAEKRDLAKAKAAAEKSAAAALKKTEGKKRDQASAEGAEDDEEEEEEEEDESDYQAALLAAVAKLKGAKDQSYEFLVCDAKPHCGVMIAKRISPKHKEILTRITGGSKRFLKVGLCRMVDGKLTFEMEEPPAGLAVKLQNSIKNFTGKKVPIQVGTESVGDQEDGPLLNAINPDLKGGSATGTPESPATSSGPFSIKGPVGRGGKNNPEDVKAVQAALNSRANAGLQVDGQFGPKTLKAIEDFQKSLGQSKPDGRIDPGRGTARALASGAKLEPPPAEPKPVAPPKLGKASLANAPDVWHGLRAVIDTNINEVKKAVRGHYAHEDPNLVKEIDQSLEKLDGITETLDLRIADSLAKANGAPDPAARSAELKIAKGILAEYIKYVKSEPLIAHLDANPWVKIELKKTLTDHLMHMAQSIG